MTVEGRASSQSQPILFGRDADGVLRHIDSVANGEACGCFCPDPSCGQVLIARNGGAKRIHHFAHKRGTCEWSAEYLISALAADIIQKECCVTFPALSYRDWVSGGEVEISPAKRLHIEEVSLEPLSGRGAPEVVVGCKLASGHMRRFALVFSLIHSLAPGQRGKLRAAGADTVLVDLREPLRQKKRELEDKHFDRVEILTGFQDLAFIREALLDEACWFKSWAVNARAAAAEEESRVRHACFQEEHRRRDEEEEKRRALERQCLEEERRAELERAQAALAEEQRLKEEKRRRLEEELRIEREKAQAAERERLRQEEEERERQRAESEERARVSIAEALGQQEYQARDIYGRRWVKCRVCGEAKLEDHFQSYGGAGSINLGLCSECYRANVKEGSLF